MKEFAGHVSFSDLSIQFAKEYERWIIEKWNKVSINAFNFKSIYAVLSKSVVSGAIKTNRKGGCQTVTRNTEKVYLTFDEIEKLAGLEIPIQYRGMSKARNRYYFLQQACASLTCAG